jgi:hypothetical protein
VNLPVLFSPHLTRTHDVFVIRDGRGREHLLAFSETTLAHLLRGVLWHDEPGHCPTWAGECRCDVEERDTP